MASYSSRVWCLKRTSIGSGDDCGLWRPPTQSHSCSVLFPGGNKLKKKKQNFFVEFLSWMFYVTHVFFLQEGVWATVSTGSEDSGSGDDERCGDLEVGVCCRSESGVQNPGLPGRPWTVPLLRFTTGKRYLLLTFSWQLFHKLKINCLKQTFVRFWGMWSVSLDPTSWPCTRCWSTNLLMQVLIRLTQECEHWATPSGLKPHYIVEYYIVPDIYLIIP